MGTVETKVKASSFGGAVAGLVLWALATYVFKDAVPDAVALVISLAVPAIVTYIAGYMAPHTPRPELTADHDSTL